MFANRKRQLRFTKKISKWFFFCEMCFNIEIRVQKHVHIQIIRRSLNIILGTRRL